jgi:hypothetical protein
VPRLNRLTIADTTLGIFWGVWFAQLSHSALNAQSGSDISTDQLRGVYVLAALVTLASMMLMLWGIQGTWRSLFVAVRANSTKHALQLGCALLGYLALLTGAVVTLPIASYAAFDGLSGAEVTLTAIIAPAWVIFMVVVQMLRLIYE